jgi:predicted Rossmann fold nucleotide-binding protein DprA/Smf involved in DNA uptake
MCDREVANPVRAALVQLEAVESESRNLLVAGRPKSNRKKDLRAVQRRRSRPIDNLVETSGLNSNEVLATLFTLELKGIVRQLPGKQFNKVLL